MNARNVITELKKYVDLKRAKVNAWFFKPEYTDPKDKFLGVSTPNFRKVAKQFQELSLDEIEILLDSHWHEVRLTGLVILTHQFEKTDASYRKKIVDFYLAHTDRINNWDLVDISAHKIVGQYVLDKHFHILDLPAGKAGKDRMRIVSPLRKLSNSKNMWERRIAMVATWMLIRAGELDQTYMLAEKFLFEQHDLMHKAVGWMLREAGKRDMQRLEIFIITHYDNMPRTMLRYAIEKFPENRRKELIKGIL